MNGGIKMANSPQPVTASQATRILTAIDRADRERAYADSLQMNAQQITGTRYRIRLNEKPSKDR